MSHTFFVVDDQGMVFEIPYAHALRDVSSRRFLIGNGASIARATGGKHIILSSGATSTMVRHQCVSPFLSSNKSHKNAIQLLTIVKLVL